MEGKNLVGKQFRVNRNRYRWGSQNIFTITKYDPDTDGCFYQCRGWRGHWDSAFLILNNVKRGVWVMIN